MTDTEITVRLADEHFAHYVLGSDFSFEVRDYASPVLGQPVARWPVQAVPAYRKHYGIDPGEFSAYLQPRAEGAIFVAWLGARPVGHVVVSTHWNNLAQVDELAVDAAARRRGVAKALLDVVRFWATRRNLPGIVLETQNNNLGACRLYERLGFELGGMDRLRYSAIETASKEVAIFWYLLFPGRSQ